MNNTKIQGSIHDQMRKNRIRTAYLLLVFPLLILGLTYIGLFISISASELEKDISPIELVNQMMSTVGFWVIIVTFIWSLISYFLGSNMIMSFAGAKPIKKTDNPTLYRSVENVSIAAGLAKTPEIYIIDDMSLNAFATGTHPNNAKVAISKGLLEKLEKNEIEAVMAHEIGHVVNRDIRVMLISITFIGAIEMLGELFIRIGANTSSDEDGIGLPVLIIGFLFITVGILIGTLTKLAISREREFLADAVSANLTNNPNALASALEKIGKDARLEILDKKMSMSGLCIADPSESGHKGHIKELSTAQEKRPSLWQRAWSTHPPITERISRLKQY